MGDRRRFAANRLAARVETSNARSRKAVAPAVRRQSVKNHAARVDQLPGRLGTAVVGAFGKSGGSPFWEERRKRRVKASALLPIALVSGLFLAGTVEAQDRVVGWTNGTCNSDIAHTFYSVDAACSDPGIRSYSLESENFDTCHVCDNIGTPSPRPVVGGTRASWSTFRERYGECYPNASHSEIKDAYDDWFMGRSSGFSCTLKEAGICADNLSNLSFRIWILRHDDIVTYAKSVSMDALSNSDEYSGGWFPQNDELMFAATALYLGQIGTGYVPGYVKSASRASSCDMPTVSDSEYTRIRGNMRNTSWTEYHFFEQNCQHWAQAHI